jgi:hypothetical protein
VLIGHLDAGSCFEHTFRNKERISSTKCMLTSKPNQYIEAGDIGAAVGFKRYQNWRYIVIKEPNYLRKYEILRRNWYCY